MKKILNRYQYIQKIYSEFDNVLEGNMGLNIITGDAGVGKTYLVENLGDFFINNKCTYVKIKLNQYNQDELSDIMCLIDQIIKHLLILPHDDFKLVQNNFRDSFTGDSQIIMSLCPYAYKIFGRKNANTRLKTSTYNERKIIDSTYQFIRLASKLLFPLVIFVDDLQWARSFTIKIIQQLLEEENKINMHVFLAYRDNCISYEDIDFLLNNQDKIIKLNEFNRNGTQKYIQSFFGNEIDNIDYLSNVIYSLSKGNPFFLNLIANEINNRDIIYKEKTGKLAIKRDEIRKLEISKDMKDIIIEEVKSISIEEKNILELISCFGGNIDYNILKIIINFPIDKLNKRLESLTDKGILIKENDDYNIVHDIIYKIIYDLQDISQRSKMYFDIANNLVKYKDNQYVKDNNLIITSFLLRTDKKYLIEDRKNWIEILYAAGIIARNRTAFETAHKIFDLCEYLISIDENIISKELYLDIQLEYMQCEFISGKEIEAKKRYEDLIKQFTNKDMLIKIKLKYIYFYSYSANWEKVISLGIEIFDDLNYHFDTRFIPHELIRSKLLYSYKSIEKIKAAPIITDKRILAILEILTIMFPATNRIDAKKFTLVTLKLAILAKRYGNSIYSCIGYASYCYLLYFVFRDYKKGYKLQQITLDILNDKDIIAIRSIPYALIGTFTYHWSNSFDDTIKCLNKSIELGEEEGEYLYSNYAVVFSIITKYVMGKKLSDIITYINKSKLKQIRLENYLTRHMYEVYISHISLLKNGYDNNDFIIEDEKQSFYDTIVLNAKMLKLHRLFLEGKLEEAYTLAKEIDHLVWKHNGFVLNGDFAFYSTLTRIGVHNNLSEKEKKINKEIIERDIKRLKKWADIYEYNHYPRYLLMKAEYDTYILKIKQNEDYYFMAFNMAKDNNNIQIQALSYLLASKHYHYNEKLSEFYKKESSKLYREWGADYIANLIYPNAVLIEKELIDKNHNANNKDIMNFISRSQKASIEEAYNYILNYIIDKFKVKHGLILIENNDKIFVKHEKIYNKEVICHKDPVNINYLSDLQHNIIRYVARTQEDIDIIHNDKINFLINNNINYESNNIKIICVPIKKNGILTNIVYLEIDSEDSVDDNISEVIKWFFTLIKQDNKIRSNTKSANDDVVLTKRELQIMDLISKGMSNNQISEKLFITVGTVRNHLSKIYSKLKVNNRVQAIIKAKEKNII